KFNSKKISGDVAIFYMQLKDLITRIKVEGEVINGYQVYRKQNSKRAVIKGVEAELNWMIVKTLKLSASMAYAKGQNVTGQEPLRRIPPLNGRLIGSFNKNNWFVATEFLFASKQRRLAQDDKEDNRIPAGGTPGWQVFNCYAGHQFKSAYINIGFQNILNEDYRTHGSGINGVGRSGWISFTLNL
nr:TonB-dependent receptor [Nitrosopumilus sp.]